MNIEIIKKLRRVSSHANFSFTLVILFMYTLGHITLHVFLKVINHPSLSRMSDPNGSKSRKGESDF